MKGTRPLTTDMEQAVATALGFDPGEVHSIRLWPGSAVVEQFRRAPDGQYVLNRRGDAVQRRFVLVRRPVEADPSPFPRLRLFRR